MKLADFIDTNMDLLLSDWMEQAQRLGAAPVVSSPQPGYSPRRLLACIAQDMRTMQSDLKQLAKSLGDHPGNAPAMTGEARAHADERLELGFSLDAVVAEYRALRASVVRRWLASGVLLESDALIELVRFDEAVDLALSESVSRYSFLLGRARDVFVGILAHDLRTPLGAIAMSAQYLLQADDLPAQVLRVSATVQRSGTRMQRMIKDVLDFTRTRLGDLLPVALAPCNLGNVCQQAITEIEAMHPDSAVRWLSDGDLFGNWDRGRLAQMLTNLLQNAIDHGRTESPVILTTHGADDVVKITVFNEGEAIPPSAWQTIFDPLTRASSDDSSRRAGAGLGLGLFIARQIALAHGGNLDVSSDNDGTTFTASLPREPVRPD